MRLFRRANDTKTSVIRREAVSAVGDAGGMEQPLRPSSRPSMPAVVVGRTTTDVATSTSAVVSAYDGREDSDVFLCDKSTPADSDTPLPSPVARKTAAEVTLFVYGWHQVEPGLLSWTFPSLRAALDAVQRMKNAIAWCVVSGADWHDLDAARASGAILVEQVT